MAERSVYAGDLTPPAAGLGIAALAAWVTLPVFHRLSPAGVLFRALVVVLLAFVLCAAAMAAVYVARGQPLRSARYLIGRIASAAAWLPPLLLFAAQGSLWTIAAGLGVTVFLLRLARYRQQTDAPRRFGLVLLASVCGEAAAAAAFTGSPVTGTALGVAAATLLAWRMTPETERNPRNWAMVGLAVFLMIGGLTRYLRLYPGGTGRSDSAQAGDQPGDRAAKAKDGDYTGVILLSEEEQRAILTPPQPVRTNSTDPKHTDPLSIPFYGAYWFFMPPDRQPPPDSFTARGDPAKDGFLSPDRRPIVMEAHQNFGRLVDLGCCSAIEMAIRNRDRYLATTGLELVLVNTTLSGRPSQSLGTVGVRSIPRGTPTEETLRFAMPPAPAIRQFDEATIRYHLADMRLERSARIAILRFVLIPRRF